MSYNDPEAIIRALEENYEKARRNGDEVEMETCRREIEALSNPPSFANSIIKWALFSTNSLKYSISASENPTILSHV